ncbi:hypothetical protein JNUCC0626_19905 [Lentzea sp. JNUCC 0626]|uniref:hypothetical protein n=1 Tax=Lentzea sp. JNUCC 0626 TaxID=3367513 RepID=UPI00374874CF
MPLPPSVQRVTVHGRYSALPDGVTPTGVVHFVPPAVLRVTADDTVVIPATIAAIVTAGEFTVSLPVTDDPAITPTGWTYEVIERLAGFPLRRYRIPVPRSTVGVLELADISPAVTPIPAQSYATTADLVALDARVDYLEAHPGGGVTDHGALTGLSNDDHPHYLNASRLNTALAPYATTAALTTGLTGKANTTHTHLTADVTGLDSTLAGKAPSGHGHAQADVTGLADTLAGKASRTVIRHAYITTGNVSPLPDTNGAWSYPGDATGLPVDFALELPAAAGDWVELGVHAMKSDNTQAFLDVAVMVGPTVVRHLSTGTATPAVEGDPAWYPPPFRGICTSRGFLVGTEHLTDGTVQFVLANKSAGAGVLYASPSFPFYWCARNLGPVL